MSNNVITNPRLVFAGMAKKDGFELLQVPGGFKVNGRYMVIWGQGHTINAYILGKSGAVQIDTLTGLLEQLREWERARGVRPQVERYAGCLPAS